MIHCNYPLLLGAKFTYCMLSDTKKIDSFSMLDTSLTGGRGWGGRTGDGTH